MTDRQAAEAREAIAQALLGVSYAQALAEREGGELAGTVSGEAFGHLVALLDDAECCSVSAYFCPVAGEVECPRHGGFDVCCDEPERHVLVDDLEVQLRECEAALTQACTNLGTIRPLDMLRDGEHDITIGEAADRWRDLVLEQGRAAVSESAEARIVQAEQERDEREAGARWQYEMGKKWKERAERAEVLLTHERVQRTWAFEQLRAFWRGDPRDMSDPDAAIAELDRVERCLFDAAVIAGQAPNPGGLPAATSPVEDLTRELGDLRRAGNELAEAAHRVSADYDGVHRLRLALSGWYAALANEWGRAET